MKLDLPLIMGYVGMLIVIMIGLILSHGTPQEIWSGEGVILAFGGATVGTLAMLSMEEIKGMGATLKVAFLAREYNYEKLIEDFIRYAEISRKDGVLALEGVANKAEDAFSRRAIQMAVDGVDPEATRDRLSLEIASVNERHTMARNIFDTLATFSPAFGMIGTIMGLVLVLKALDDPSQLGPKMAVALLSTFYGVFACYAVFTPVAKKLERKHKHELLYRQMVVEAIHSIQTGDNPRVVAGKLRAFLREKRG